MLNKPLIPFDLNCKIAKGAFNKENALKGVFFRSCGNFVPSCTYLLSRVLALWMSLSWSAEILSGRSWAEAEARRQAAARASTEAMVRMVEREVLLHAARDVLLGGVVLPPPLLPTV